MTGLGRKAVLLWIALRHGVEPGHGSGRVQIRLLREQYAKIPYAVCDACRHSRRYAKRAVNGAEVVIGEVQAEAQAHRFSHFFEYPFVNRVSLRICIR